jgi:Leucine-rich repeat (LRR) protein
MEQNESSFTTTLPVLVYAKPTGDKTADWQEIDHGPGLIHLPVGSDISIRVHNIDDRDLAGLLKEISHLAALTYLNLSENRKVTDEGIKALKILPQITRLNLSSCGITNIALDYLRPLSRLESLDLSYCNRITDPALKAIKNLPRLTFLDLQGCVKITNGGLSRMRRPNLTIHR